MGDMFFFIKMLIFTLVLIVVMQVKIGPLTLEERVLSWTHESSFAQTLQGVARGGVKAIQVGWGHVSSAASDSISDKMPEVKIPKTGLGDILRKSKKIVEEKMPVSGEGSSEDTSPEDIEPMELYEDLEV